MLRLNVRAAVEIGDGPRNLADAVVAPRAHLQTLKRRFHQRRARLVERAALAQRRRVHQRIAADGGSGKAAVLNLTR